MRTTRHTLSHFVLVVGTVVACSSDRSPSAPTGPVLSEALDLLAMATPTFGEWSSPVSLGPVVNSEFIDNSPELSRDGLSLYFGSNRPGGVGSVDLWVTRRACTDETDASCAWGPPVNLGPTINTTRIDGGPHLSRDGHWLFLISDRPGGFGSNDIWLSYRADVNDDLAWQAPVNIGAPINTAELEAGPNLRGMEFYFHRGPAAGNTDIYVSRVIDGTFRGPVLVEELSAAGSFEQRPSTRWDGREMILSSDRAGGIGLQDIWTSTRPGNGLPWTTPVNLGPTINTPFQEQTPTITDDGTMLLFSSNRTGQFDLYMSTRTREDSY